MRLSTYPTLLHPAIETEHVNGGVEQGLLEIIGRGNLSEQHQVYFDTLQALPRDRGITTTGDIVDLRTHEIVGKI